MKWLFKAYRIVLRQLAMSHTLDRLNSEMSSVWRFAYVVQNGIIVTVEL